jgi:hypothetical protein
MAYALLASKFTLSIQPYQTAVRADFKQILMQAMNR